MRDRSPPNITTYVAQVNINLLSKGCAGPYTPTQHTADAAATAPAATTAVAPAAAATMAATAISAAAASKGSGGKSSLNAPDGEGSSNASRTDGGGVGGLAGYKAGVEVTTEGEKTESSATSWDQAVWNPLVLEYFEAWVPGGADDEGEVGWYVPNQNLYVKYPLL
jgi:hypothetical protein